MSGILSKEVRALGFGFFNGDEIKRLSVKQVTVPYVFDSFNQPVANGLYDPAMGPLDERSSCASCNLPYSECIGHFGHIELHQPVYHPLLFDLMYKLLRAKCFVCHHLRIPRIKVKRLITALKLVDAGLLLKAKDIDNSVNYAALEKDASKDEAKQAKELEKELKAKEKQKQKEQDGKTEKKSTGKRKRGSEEEHIDSGDENEDEDKDKKKKKTPARVKIASPGNNDLHNVRTKQSTLTKPPSDDELNRHLDALQALAEKRGRELGTYRLTRQDLEYRKQLTRSFLAEISRKCPNCNAHTPNLRRDGHSKIFRLPLLKTQAAANKLLGLSLADVFSDADGQSQGVRDAEDQMAAKMQAEENRKKSKKAKSTAPVSKKSKKEEIKSNKNGKSAKQVEDDSSGMDDSEELEKEVTIDKKQSNGTDEVADLEAEASKRPTLMLPHEVEAHLRHMWARERDILNHIYGGVSRQTDDMPSHEAFDYRAFFVRVLAVPPPKYRPPMKQGDKTFDHPQNLFFKRALEYDRAIVEMMSIKQNEGVEAAQQQAQLEAADKKKEKKKSRKGDDKQLVAQDADGAAVVPASGPRVVDYNKVANAWVQLQLAVNCLIDSNKAGDKAGKQANTGIRQSLEKKQGLFRMHMMGKRVNFAARSVISPDPNLHTKEVGIPDFFARTLTFPEPVTPWNVAEMRQAVINGPTVHPGANAVQDERGHVVELAGLTRAQRIALSKTLLTPPSLYATASKQRKVGQQAALGVKRVLRHLKTGDVLLVNRQPTLHKPSIMAHIARVLTGQQTIRMHYANCSTYNADFDGDELNLHFPQNQLARAEAYNIANTNNQYVKPTDGSPIRGLIQDHVVSGVLLTKRDTFFTKEEFQQLVYGPCPESTTRFTMPEPAIIKPVKRWTGKQVITCILNVLCAGREPLNMESKAKVAPDLWGKGNREESTVIFRQNELVTGVLDKAQFGASSYGLVHACYILYGAETAGDLLTTLGRLFTLYLQNHGFTCGIDDMLLTAVTEKGRRGEFVEAATAGVTATREFVEPEPGQTLEQALQAKLRSPGFNERLDGHVNSVMNSFTSRVVKGCLPNGTAKLFPENWLSLMTNSGAKGSSVNFHQISCLLGQLELEGRRPPFMPSGKTLPCFKRYDCTPRAGGFVTDRFLTGLRPQEYFFHCMAGREGLVDTAVKTARAGYLQRCLIKHLESLKVNYDHTVRDNDGSVIQFHYGEDSIDVAKSAPLDELGFLLDNYKVLAGKVNPKEIVDKMDSEAVPRYLEAKEEAERAAKENGESIRPWDPVLAHFPPGHYFGAVSERFEADFEAFVAQNKDKFVSGSPKDKANKGKVDKERFHALLQMLYAAAVVDPGESVGILVAQSVGEPATQMTLNTFHLAGHGGTNVTLGLPRLRELIMTASQVMKTPVMDLPVRAGVSEAEAQKAVSRLHRLRLVDFVTDLSVRESLDTSDSTRLYTVRIDWLPTKHAQVVKHRLKSADFVAAIEKQLAVKLNLAVKKEVKAMDRGGSGVYIASKKSDSGAAVSTPDTPEEADAHEEDAKPQSKKRRPLPGSQLSAEAARQRRKHTQAVSYDEGDEDDQRIQEEQDKQQGSGDYEDENDTEEGAKGKAKSKKAPAVKSGAEEEEAEEEDTKLAKGEWRTETGSDGWVRRIPPKCEYIRHVSHRAEKETTFCEIVVAIPLRVRKLLIMSIVEGLYEHVVLRAKKDIMKAMLTKRKNEALQEEMVILTEGVNFAEAHLLDEVIDVNRITSNDVGAMLRTYGVEAARGTIMNEIMKVFKHYSISVNRRHIGLLADYMTHQGGFSPLNRIGIDVNASPLQKMCFETSVHFLQNACLEGDVDYMQSPSSRLVVGSPVAQGTGCFELVQPLPSTEAA